MISLLNLLVNNFISIYLVNVYGVFIMLDNVLINKVIVVNKYFIFVIIR